MTMAIDVGAAIAALNALSGGTQSQVIGGSSFPALQGPYGGIWNEAGYVELDNNNPLYVSGDEWKQLPTDGAELADLQHKLIAAGYMTDDNIVFGSPDAKTASAMAQLLGSSNATGKVWQTTLAARLTMAGQQPQAGKKPLQGAPLTIQLTNPDDIKAVIQSGANQIFGKYLDPAEVDKFVSAYQGQEAAYQTAQQSAAGLDPYGREILNPDGTRATQPMTQTAPASSAGMQREFFDQMAAAHPTETRVAIFQDKLDEILNALKGPA